MTYNPWQDAARRHAQVHIARTDLPSAHGAWVPSEQVILLAAHLDKIGRRCSLAHELAHIDLGHTCTGQEHIDARQEVTADILAARRLISLDALATAVLDVPDRISIVAERLNVTDRIAQSRVTSLHPTERSWVQRQIEKREFVA